MITVDLDAVRERSDALVAAVDLLTTSPNPAHAANAHQVAIASATDVPLLLDAVGRLKAERDSLRERFDEARREIAALRSDLHDARFDTAEGDPS